MKVVQNLPGAPGFEAIAARVFECDGTPNFEVKLGCPTLAPEGDCWFCEYEIQGPLTKRRGRFGGEDAMQALVNALYCLSVDVEVSPENTSGRLTWLGQKNDLGLPVPPILAQTVGDV